MEHVKNQIKLLKDFNHVLAKTQQDPKVILLARCMELLSRKHGIKKGRSIYLEDDLGCYETVTVDQVRPYRILENAGLKGIDDLKWLSLFCLNRRKYNLKDKYWHKWVYHASFSPIWTQRLRQCRAYCSYIKQDILFVNDDCLEDFYNRYGLEPDEQRQEIQDKSTMEIEEKHNWLDFYAQFKRNGLVDILEEELEAFDEDKMVY